MTELNIYRDRWKLIRNLIIAIGFVFISLLLLARGGGYAIIGGLSLLLFGFGTIVFVRELLNTNPVVQINELGIFDPRLHHEIINWAVIESAYIGHVSDVSFVSLKIDEQFEPSKKRNRWYRLISKANKQMGFQELNLNCSNLKVDVMKLAILINICARATPDERKQHLQLGFEASR